LGYNGRKVWCIEPLLLGGLIVMDGIKYLRCQTTHSHILKVEFISDELKTKIKEWLVRICYGEINAEEDGDYFSYQSTLKAFFERFDKKSVKQKKGIIAELLSHVVIIYFFKYFKTISVLFNKEDKSMRKGFDIVVYDTNTSLLWYSEVKSGDGGSNPQKKNLDLLTNAKEDICVRLKDTSKSTWDSALHDTNLTTSKEVRNKIRQLLKNDYLSIESKQELEKRVILISVLYKGTTDIDIDTLTRFHNDLLNEKIFTETIIMTIQKNTYQAIEHYLRSELKGVSTNVR
jgi:hypothetical protein